MADPYRHSIGELATRYELEPGLRDLYVEGENDRWMLEWFFTSIGSANVRVYPIEAVDVPPELLDEHVASGNRGRVLALCRQLEDRLRGEARSVRGLIDKDDSDLLGITFASRHLLLTDFSCLECYALSGRMLFKLFRLYFGKDIEENRIRELLEVAVEVFALRAAKNATARSAKWIDEFTRYCSVRSSRVDFDCELYIERLVNASGGTLNAEALQEKFKELRRKASGDVRQSINGHDLVKDSFVVRAQDWCPNGDLRRESASPSAYDQYRTGAIKRHATF